MSKSIVHQGILGLAVLVCYQCLNQPQTVNSRFEPVLEDLQKRGLLRKKLVRVKDEEGKEIVVVNLRTGRPIIAKYELTDSALFLLNGGIERQDKLTAYIVAQAIYDEAFPIKPDKASVNSDDYNLTIQASKRGLEKAKIDEAYRLAGEIISIEKIGFKAEIAPAKVEKTVKPKATKPKAVKVAKASKTQVA